MDEESQEYLLGPPAGYKLTNRLTRYVWVIGFLAVTCFITAFYIVSSRTSEGYASIRREISKEAFIHEKLAKYGQTAERRGQKFTQNSLFVINVGPPPNSRRGSPHQRDQDHQSTVFFPNTAATRQSIGYSDSQPARHVFLNSDPDPNEATHLRSQLDRQHVKHIASYPHKTTEEGSVNMTGYLVYSPSCRIPDTPPFHDSIKHLYKKQTEPPCSSSSRPPLTSISKTSIGNVLRLHKEHFAKYEVENVSCCFNRFWRTKLDSSKRLDYYADDKVTYSRCIEFKGDVALNEDDEFLQVTCILRGNSFKLKYTNVHAIVAWKPEVGKKMWDADQNRLKSKQKTLSVMIIGLDSVARKNLIRTMPNTVGYLESNGWIGLKGYNKIGFNTFPAMWAMFAGLNMSQIEGKNKCWPSRYSPLDKCPLIWRNFSRKGYITAYIEDQPTIGSFNFQKSGFRKPPTDYYLRPFMIAAHKLVKRKYSQMDACMGSATPAQHILNYSINFATTFREYPTFSLFWMNGMHEDLNRPTTMDEQMRSYFGKYLIDSGALNTTMVMFMSDHGMRYGAIRRTYVGYIEDRLPFMYFWLPEWFKTAYPRKVKNLIKNTNRLTSPYDIYMTLAEVLGLQTEAESCPKCISLFKEVPWNRSCTDAGISDHWCTCTGTITSSVLPAKVVGKFVVKVINNILQKYTSSLSNGTRCSKLKFKKVLSMKSKTFSKNSGFEEYVVVVQTVPGNAQFEATVSHKNTYRIVDTISRINSYANQSACIDNYFAKNYCFCERT